MEVDEWKNTSFASLIEQGVLEIGDGYRAKNEELGGTGPIFLRAGHVRDTHIDFNGVERFHSKLEGRVRSKLSRVGDTIVTTKGNSTGRTSYVDDGMPPFVYSPHLSYWRSLDHSRLAEGFLRYWSKGAEFTSQLAGMAASTDMAPYLSLIDQRRLRISLPSIEQQRFVGRVLGAMDDKIELNRRMSATLEAMARALFKSWFVEFSSQAETNNTEPTRGESDLPAGWRRGTVANLARLVFSGGTPDTTNPSFWNGTVPWLSSGETRDKFVTTTERTITQEGVEGSSTRWAPKFATVIASAGQGNTRGQTSLLLFETYINQSVVALVANDATSSPLHLFFDLERRYDEFRRVSDGHSSRGSLTTKLLASLEALIPTRHAIERFDRIVEPMVLRIGAARRESEALTALRDTLLPKLISGELRVKDAEKQVEQVL